MIIEPKREILIGPLIRIAVTRAWAARDHFIRLAVLPVIALLLIASPFEQMLAGVRIEPGAPIDAETAPRDPAILLQALLLGLCYGAIMVVFAVNWIRVLTLGPQGAPGLGQAIGMRHLRFFLLVLGLTVAVLVPAMVAATVLAIVLGSYVVGVLTSLMLSMLLWAALLARISPSWIGIAIDAPMSISVAWRRTAGQGFKLLMAMIVVEVALMLVQQVVASFLAISGMAQAAPYASLLVVAVLGLIGIALQVAVLVSAFPQFLRETV